MPPVKRRYLGARNARMRKPGAEARKRRPPTAARLVRRRVQQAAEARAAPTGFMRRSDERFACADNPRAFVPAWASIMQRLSGPYVPPAADTSAAGPWAAGSREGGMQNGRAADSSISRFVAELSAAAHRAGCKPTLELASDVLSGLTETRIRLSRHAHAALCALLALKYLPIETQKVVGSIANNCATAIDIVCVNTAAQPGTPALLCVELKVGGCPGVPTAPGAARTFAHGFEDVPLTQENLYAAQCLFQRRLWQASVCPGRADLVPAFAVLRVDNHGQTHFASVLPTKGTVFERIDEAVRVAMLCPSVQIGKQPTVRRQGCMCATCVAARAAAC